MKETSGEPKNILGLEGDRPRPGSAGGLPRALRAGQSFSGKECLARRGRPRPGPAWFARLTGPLAPPPGLAPDRGAPRSGGTRRPSPITQKLVRPVPDSWRRAPLQEKKKKGTRKRKKQARERARPAARNGLPTRTARAPTLGTGTATLVHLCTAPTIIQWPGRGGRCAAHRSWSASSGASWVGRRPHARGPDVRKLFRGGL